MKVLAAFIAKRANNTPPAPSSKSMPTERQQFLALHPGYSKHNVAIVVYIPSFDRVYRLKPS